MSRRDYPRALRYLDQVVAIAPEYAEGLEPAGDGLLPGRAIRRFARRHRPHIGLGAATLRRALGRGLVLTELEREEEALRSFEEALTIIRI